MVFLHQTTTCKHTNQAASSCFLWCSYIKPQPNSFLILVIGVVSYGVPTSNHNLRYGIREIELVVSYGVPTSNHNGTYRNSWTHEVVSYGVPTSNHNALRAYLHSVAVVSYGVPTSNHNAILGSLVTLLLFLMVFLHQTTTFDADMSSQLGCFLWCSYIKPQQSSSLVVRSLVVSYGVPTSNHNPLRTMKWQADVVSYGVPTSNHNTGLNYDNNNPLFLMVFLHQTTTCRLAISYRCMLFLMVFLHQTTTDGNHAPRMGCCFLWCSYIKPQRTRCTPQI